MSDILAARRWPTNAHLIEDVARLGYLRMEWYTLDPTFGQGVFWKRWRPHVLVGHDLKVDGVDFTKLPYQESVFDAVVFDPPYKLNGTSTPQVDARYGVDGKATIEQRHALMLDGLDECIRVFNGHGYLHVKCMDQVASGKVHWQTHMMTRRAEESGLRLVDSFLFLHTHRPQRSQVHARRNYSTLLTFR